MSDYHPPDPYALTRREQARVLPKRFYSEVATGTHPAGHVILLDGKPAKRPDGAVLALPDAALAKLLADEWAAQGAFIDMVTMPLTKLVLPALAALPAQRLQWQDEIVNYAGHDLVCYRAEHPDTLVAMQARAWDGVIDWANAQLQAPFEVTAGISAVQQSTEALDQVRAALRPFMGEPMAIRLAALNTMTVLLGSALMALMCAKGAISAEAAWSAGHVDEDFQIGQWGIDEEAATRRTARARDFAAAAQLAGWGKPASKQPDP